MSTAVTKLRILVGNGRNIASARKLYCEVSVIDGNGVKIGSPQKTSYCSKSSNPVWNQELKFDSTNVTGFALTVWERHTIFPDKFLGIVTVKFSNKKRKEGDELLNDWFTLNQRKASDHVSGVIQIAVTYGVKGAKTPVGEKKKSSKSTDDDDGVGGVKRDLKVSSKWKNKDSLLDSNGFVIIEEDIEDSEEERKKKKRNPRKDPKKIQSPASGDSADKKKPSVPSVSTPTGTPKNRRMSLAPDGSPVPLDLKGQLDLIVKMSSQDESLLRDVEKDDTSNLSFALYNPKKDQESFVTLMIPENIRRGEYTLFTHDGIIELGKPGSVLAAMNKVIEEFAETSNLPEWAPEFPEPDLPDEPAEPEPVKGGRKTLMESAWSHATMDSEIFDIEEPDHHDNPEEPLNATQTNAAIEPYIDEFKKLHGPGKAAIVFVSKVRVLRLLMDIKLFLNDLMAEIWDLDISKFILIEIDLPPYWSDASATPKINVYQTGEKDIQQEDISKTSFGLQWYLQKRIEKFLSRNWPPKNNTYLFLDLMSHVMDKITTCTKACVICDKKLDFSMLKPTICDSALCQFSYDQYGLGTDVAAAIKHHPEVVDLLISITDAAAQGDARRFNPYPTGVETKFKQNGKEVVKSFTTPGSKDGKDLPLLHRLLDKLPPIKELQKFDSSNQIRQYLNEKDALLYPLLRWIITSNRAHLAALKPSERIGGIGTSLQYLLLSTPPEKERKFQEAKKRHGAFWAFHGSGFANWHAILRTGLRNLSNTELMSAGAVYGAGIYLAAESGTSIGYAAVGRGWVNSMFNESHGTESLQCLALCEVISAGYKANPYYVIPNEDHVVTRYLFLFNSKNRHSTTQAAGIKIPKTNYDSELVSMFQ